ncbi:TMEM175 family protein [Methanobrevibacter sp.]
METNRFETFFDAIIAIIITILVLKLPQPASPTLEGFLELNTIYIAYIITFLILYNIWYSNHNLFQLVENIDNTTVWIYGAMIFVISLLPYFTIWLAKNIYSVPAETMFGVLFILTHILYTLATHAIYRSNPYNEQLQLTDFDSRINHAPGVIIIIGFILTYTVYIPGIYICCLISIIMWIFIERILRRGDDGN